MTHEVGVKWEMSVQEHIPRSFQLSRNFRLRMKNLQNADPIRYERGSALSELADDICSPDQKIVFRFDNGRKGDICSLRINTCHTQHSH